MFKNWFIFIAPILLLGACSSDSSGDSAASENEIASSITTVSSKLGSMSDMIGGTSSSSLNSNSNLKLRAALNSVWEDTDSEVSSLFNGGEYTLKQWFVDQFDDSFVNSNGAKVTFAGRMANTLDILCYLGEAGLTSASDNLPAAGTYSIAITSSMDTTCGGDGGSVGVDVTLTVTETTDTTYYDKKLSFQLGDANAACPFVYYARINSSAINLATAEDQNCDGRNHASMSVFHLDKATDDALFVYYSKSFEVGSSGFEMYRGYINETNSDAKIIGFYGGITGTTRPFDSGIGFTAAGSPDDNGDVALSALSIGQNELANGTYEGCVDKATLVATGSALTCDKTGVSIGTASTGAFDDVINTQFDAFTTIEQVLAVDETTTPGFTNTTDMFQ